MLVASKIQGSINRQSSQHSLVSNRVQITWEGWQQPDPTAGTAKISIAYLKQQIFFVVFWTSDQPFPAWKQKERSGKKMNIILLSVQEPQQWNSDNWYKNKSRVLPWNTRLVSQWSWICSQRNFLHLSVLQSKPISLEAHTIY